MRRLAIWSCAVVTAFAMAAHGQDQTSGIVRLTDGGNLVADGGKTASGAAVVVPATGGGGDNWWSHAVLYEIYPRSFQDSNGDGIGDINGITSRLDYLKDLGIDAIWISPMYPSPLIDFGYDISDYTAIDPLYGSLADFDHLVSEAKTRNIRV